MEEKISGLIENWQKRNIRGSYCQDKEEAAGGILRAIPLSASVGISGSVTLDQIEIVRRLEGRGNQVFNQYRSGIDRQESMALRQKGASADFYLTGVNAISQKGELVFFSAYGNRTCGIANARKVIVVAGINKIVPDVDSALRRAREYATPMNCRRLNYDTPCFKDGICQKEICLFPEYKRMCCQILILEAEVSLDRLEVILVGENLGF
ncbi:MAG: lactate utilization protein [Candidatus Omnitrophota bacterium]